MFNSAWKCANLQTEREKNARLESIRLDTETLLYGHPRDADWYEMHAELIAKLI